jgi:hypothetical protein
MPLYTRGGQPMLVSFGKLLSSSSYPAISLTWKCTKQLSWCCLQWLGKTQASDLECLSPTILCPSTPAGLTPLTRVQSLSCWSAGVCAVGVFVPSSALQLSVLFKTPTWVYCVGESETTSQPISCIHINSCSGHLVIQGGGHSLNS